MLRLQDRRLLVLIFVSIGVLAGLGNGILAQTFNQEEGFSWVNFIVGFVNALLVQSILIGILLAIASRWPKISGILILLFVLGGLLILPSYFKEPRGQFIDQPYLAVIYLIVIGLYLLVAGILFMRQKKQTDPRGELIP